MTSGEKMHSSPFGHGDGGGGGEQLHSLVEVPRKLTTIHSTNWRNISTR